MILKAFLAGTCLGGCLLFVDHVQAAPGDATRLEYARSAQAAVCPDRNALATQVSKRLGYDPFFHAARQTISVEIIDADGTLRAQMRLMNENGIIVGSRELREQAGHCDELVASLALAISIALDPSAALGEEPEVAIKEERASAGPAETSPEPEPEPAAQEHPQKPKQTRDEGPATALEDRDPFRFALRSTLFADWGTAPAIAFGFRVGIDLSRKHYRLGAEFVQQLPASKELDQGGYARTSLVGGMLTPCFVRAGLSACGLAILGVLQARGQDIPSPSSRTLFYATLGVRVEFAPALSRTLQLVTQIEGTKPLTPVSLQVVGEEVWHSPVLTAAFAAGLRWSFPVTDSRLGH